MSQFKINQRRKDIQDSRYNKIRNDIWVQGKAEEGSEYVQGRKVIWVQFGLKGRLFFI